MKSVNATRYELIPTYPSKKNNPFLVHAIVETPQGSQYKFALEPDKGIIALREKLPPGYRWPYDYGFVPQTLGDDGDPLDILVLVEEPTFSGCMVKARLLGAIRLKKNGVENDRFIAAPKNTDGVPLASDKFEQLSDIGDKQCRQLEEFLCGYSEGQGNKIEIVGRVDRDEASELIRTGHKEFKKKNG